PELTEPLQFRSSAVPSSFSSSSKFLVLSSEFSGYPHVMCDLNHAHDHQHFGFLVDTPEIRALIDETKRLTAAIGDVAARADALRPAFARLLASEGWLPDACAKPDD